MKKGSRRMQDDLRPEYDLAALGPGVRGKYAGRLRGTTLVALNPEVAAAFPTSEAVNEALRAVLRAKTVARRSTSARRRAKTSGRGK
jgi:hypothetical protein